MFLYPLAIAIIILAFTSPLFKHKQIVYILTIIITFLVSIIDGIKTLCETLEIDYYNWLIPIINLYEKYLPMYEEGLGWFVPFMIVLDRKSTRLNSSHVAISYAVFCLKKKKHRT